MAVAVACSRCAGCLVGREVQTVGVEVLGGCCPWQAIPAWLVAGEDWLWRGG